jgi:hypothetical protein
MSMSKYYTMTSTNQPQENANAMTASICADENTQLILNTDSKDHISRIPSQ